jgi:hypothetical protein
MRPGFVLGANPVSASSPPAPRRRHAASVSDTGDCDAGSPHPPAVRPREIDRVFGAVYAAANPNVVTAVADDNAHRPRWISLRPRDARHGRQRDSARCQTQKLSAGKFHRVSVPRGRRTVKTEPLPGSLVTVTSPPIMRASLDPSGRKGWCGPTIIQNGWRTAAFLGSVSHTARTQAIQSVTK